MDSRLSMVFALVAVLTVGRGNSAVPSPESSRLRLQLDSYAYRLASKVHGVSSDKEKYQALRQALGEMRGLRERSVGQSAQEGAYVDLMISALEFVPDENSFSKKKCPQYESDFLDQFEPMAEETPQEPAVLPGWDVLRALCD